MNSRQLQYVVLLSQVRNFSQVAEKLGITQPALSKQILNLELELGIKLFDRTTIPLTVTPAGEHFVKEAQELLYREDQLLRSMEDYKTGEVGRLVIGITPFRSSYLIPCVIKQIRNKYPGIQIQLHEAGSDILRKEVAEGKYDFAIVNLPVDDSVLDILPLDSDQLAIVVPHEYEQLIEFDADTKEVNFHKCKELPFVVVGQTQEMRILFDRLCVMSGFQPIIAAEVVGLATAWAMVCAGVGATILPMQFIKEKLTQEKLSVYPLKEEVYTRQPAVVTRRGQYLSSAAQYAINLLINPT